VIWGASELTVANANALVQGSGEVGGVKIRWYANGIEAAGSI
jgi:hypothetical protein